MMSRLHRYFVLALVVSGAALLSGCRDTPWEEWPAGRLAPHPPVQSSVSAVSVHVKGDWTIRPIAQFEVEALVLSREPYYVDATASISPVDLALGWGGMSDPAVLRRLDIWQAGRFMFWETDDVLPIPKKEIIRSSANMHMIPASEEVEAVLDEVKPGDVVRITGALVFASTEGGYTWRSSMTRTDTGDGACEIVWVEQIDIVG